MTDRQTNSRGATGGDTAESEVGARAWMGEMCTGLLSTRAAVPPGRCRLLLSTEGIEMKGGMGEYWLPRDRIRCITGAGFFPWLWMGLQFHHSVAEYPRVLKFTARGNTGEIIAHAEACGYRVVPRRERP